VKVLLYVKFSLKKGEKIIYLMERKQLLIFGEKISKEKKFPLNFYRVGNKKGTKKKTNKGKMV